MPDLLDHRELPATLAAEESSSVLEARGFLVFFRLCLLFVEDDEDDDDDADDEDVEDSNVEDKEAGLSELKARRSWCRGDVGESGGEETPVWFELEGDEESESGEGKPANELEPSSEVDVFRSALELCERIDDESVYEWEVVDEVLAEWRSSSRGSLFGRVLELMFCLGIACNPLCKSTER